MTEFQTSEDRLRQLSLQTIPAALGSLSNRHETLTQAVQYLEGNYLSATFAGKKEAEDEAKSYMLNALQNVAYDIEALAVGLDELVEINTSAVDSLTNQVYLLQSRLRTSKEQHAQDGLQDIRIPQKILTEVASRELCADEMYAPLSEFKRIPISQRLAAAHSSSVPAADCAPVASTPSKAVRKASLTGSGPLRQRVASPSGGGLSNP